MEFVFKQKSLVKMYMKAYLVMKTIFAIIVKESYFTQYK